MRFVLALCVCVWSASAEAGAHPRVDDAQKRPVPIGFVGAPLYVPVDVNGNEVAPSVVQGPIHWRSYVWGRV